jgi:hypothetical protein
MGLSSDQLRPVDPILVEHARRLGGGGFIADEVFPQLSKPGQETGQLLVWDDSHLLIPDDSARAVGAQASEAEAAEPTYIAYETITHARKSIITPRELKKTSMSPDRLKASRVAKVMRQVKAIREKDLADKLNATGNYDSGLSTTLGAGVVWTADAGDPAGDILTGIGALMAAGIDCTSLHAACDQAVWKALAHHAALREYMKYTKAGKVSIPDFADFFGINVHVATCIYNAAGTITPIWGDSFIIYYIPATLGNNNEEDMCFGRTIVSEDFSFVEWDDPTRDHAGAQWVEAQMAFKHEFVGVDNSTDKDSDAGYLIDNAI